MVYTIIFYLLAIGIILVGVFIIREKYKVVVNGICCKAKVLKCEKRTMSYRFSVYNYIVEFTYKGKRMKRATLETTMFPKRKEGKQFYIYFNEKHPLWVVKKGFEIDILGSICIITGLGFIVQSII